MDQEPWYIKFLDKLGVNTTKLRWRLYQSEQKAKNVAQGGPVPKGLQWMSYEHKLCKHCGAVNDRDARICSSCSEKLPSVLGYKISRLMKTAAPSDSPVVTNLFLGLIALMLGLQLIVDGLSFRSIMTPNGVTMAVLGIFNPDFFYKLGHYWRALAFGLLHGGLIHIGFNSFFLIQIGPMVERQIGRAKMMVLITVSQLGAAAACFVWYYLVQGNYQVRVLGASGWLFGLLGFGISYAHNLGQLQLRDMFLKNMAFILVLGFIIPGISNTAHIGGLLAGLAVGFLPMGDNLRRDIQVENSTWKWASIFCAVLWFVTLVYIARSLHMHWDDLKSIV
jgi:rhomboid protease GluP